MKMKHAFRHYIFALLCIISCVYTSVFAASGNLLSYKYLGEFDADKARLTLQAVPPLNTLDPVYSVKLYKINYKTAAPDGSGTQASGLVAMPVNPPGSVSVVSYFHGTRVTRSDVPSNFAQNYYPYPAVFSNTGGYMLVMPDYLGLGDSELALHPYVLAESLAVSCIDMITAARELAVTLKYPVNDKLFLAGNSEGGFTTMVTYEALLRDHPEIPVTAAAPGSAPYDWDETVPFITTQPGPRASVYAAYFFYSMQTYFHYWSGLAEIFKSPYDTLVPVLFDGTHDATEVQKALPVEPKDLLRDEFFKSIVEGTDPHINQLISNLNHYDFVSTSPLLLVGSKGDHDLPFHGAEIAYGVLKAKSDKVYLKSVSDVLDHIQAFPFVTKEQLDFFRQYS